MMQDRYQLAFTLYPYVKHRDQTGNDPAHHPVVIIGAGPIGMALALDLGRQGQPVLVLDDHEGVGAGSRAICFSKRTLDIAARYGCAEAMVEKGVVWNTGKVFYDDRQIYAFDLLPEAGHRHPAFINLQQPYFEKFLFDQIQAEIAKGAPIAIRGKNRVAAVEQNAGGVTLKVETPDGPYLITTDWVVACDGAASPTRAMLGLEFQGRVFEDSFLIADIKMTTEDFPTERWFWFEPHFKSGASTLLHKQPDDIWRVDFQIGWDVDREEELKEDNIRARLDAMLGSDVTYELVWSSIYTFQCRRMQELCHGRVIFAGDAAHQVSPFGARGANSGLQDVDNLGWKLGLVLTGNAPAELLDSYHTERAFAADENIVNSTRSTDFITPKSKMSRIFRNAVLELAEHHDFARQIVNSGRLSLPSTYDGLCLNGPDALPGGPAITRVGSACPDAALSCGAYLLDHLGNGFTLLTIDVEAPDDLNCDGIPLPRLALNRDNTPFLRERYLGEAACAVYLIRPDQHVAARWAEFDHAAVMAAMRTACAKSNMQKDIS